MSTTRTAPGTWQVRKLGEDCFVEAKIQGKAYGQEILGDDYFVGLSKDSDARFIVLADHHFDAMEKALRTAQAAMCLYHCFATGENKKDDSPPTKHIRACKQALDVLSAIDKERSSHA